MGLFIHYYIIFGTNLLTGGLDENCCFFACFCVSKKRNIKRSPNGMKPLGMWFSHRSDLGDLDPTPRSARGGHEGGGRPLGTPLPRGPLRAPPTYSFLLYIPTYPRMIRKGAKNLIPPPQLSVSTRSHLGTFFGDLPEGDSITEGFYINIIASPMMCE